MEHKQRRAFQDTVNAALQDMLQKGQSVGNVTSGKERNAHLPPSLIQMPHCQDPAALKSSAAGSQLRPLMQGKHLRGPSAIRPPDIVQLGVVRRSW